MSIAAAVIIVTAAIPSGVASSIASGAAATEGSGWSRRFRAFADPQWFFVGKPLAAAPGLPLVAEGLLRGMTRLRMRIRMRTMIC